MIYFFLAQEEVLGPHCLSHGQRRDKGVHAESETACVDIWYSGILLDSSWIPGYPDCRPPSRVLDP